MREAHGVRKGQRVRTVDGDDLGRVTKLYDGGFAVLKGFPILFGQTSVLRYDEVRGERDGALVVARSRRDLFDLSDGEIPPAWRVPVPHGFPAAATPAEAREIYSVVASWPVAGVRPGDAPATPAQPAGPATADSQAVQARAATGEEVTAGERASAGAYRESHGQRTSLIWEREDRDRNGR
jgi:hypothetical protein